MLFTDAQPLVERPAPPNAEQASAIRMAVSQLRADASPGSRTAQRMRLTPAQLAAASALASDAFEPDRLLVEIDGDRINVTISHQLPFGRWLNTGLVGQGSKTGFPEVHLTIGSVSFPAKISRSILEAVRLVVNLRGANLPPLDILVQSFRIENAEAVAMVHLPIERGMGIEVARIRDTYCRLTRLQSSTPTDDLAEAIRRAFSAETASTATAASNRAAFVALAMLIVSPDVGEFVGVSSEDVRACAQGPAALKLHGRADLAKHWSLSAALAVTSGADISQAMGEWKELSDSVSRQSQFAAGDPTGFSFLDIAADRSGFLIARNASDAARARSVATQMSRIDQNRILPPTLMRLEDGMPESLFVQTYGTIKDERFFRKIEQIDRELNGAIPK